MKRTKLAIQVYQKVKTYNTTYGQREYQKANQLYIKEQEKYSADGQRKTGGRKKQEEDHQLVLKGRNFLIGRASLKE